VFIFDFDAFRQRDRPRRAKRSHRLRRLLEAPRPIKIAHNAKFDAKFHQAQSRRRSRRTVRHVARESTVGAGDIEERHGLETVASRYLNESVDKSERLSNWNFELSEAQLEYAARDAAVCCRLREKLIERLKSESLIKCAQLEFECVIPVVDIELAGFFMHKDRWLEQLGIVEKRASSWRNSCSRCWRRSRRRDRCLVATARTTSISIRTAVDASAEPLGIPVPDSTRNWKMQPLAREYPVIATLLEYRTVQKALTSYGRT
jgi:DNA polymerase I-like protein with 3'-5' exonuclease and polymerase domains